MADVNRFLLVGASTLHGAAFACVAAVLVLSPWAFGAWEMWWFWPMAAVLFAGALMAGLGTLLNSAFAPSNNGTTLEGRFRGERRLATQGAACLPFLLYAVWRAARPSGVGYPLVELEAERSLLLFATPVLLAVTLFLTGTRRRLRGLVGAFLGNGVLLALYALVSLWQNQGTYVLWVRTPFNYGARAGGPFFCPNHLAAYLNVALCLIAAVLLTRGTRATTRLVLAVVALPIVGAWFATLSRGGMASLLATVPIAVLIGLRGYPWRARLVSSLVLLALAVGAAWAVLTVPNPLLQRLQSHALYQSLLAVRTTGWAPVRTTFLTKFDRGMYIASAMRAWHSNPTWGIGPGQHPTRWPQFAATDDGDRATRRWPTLTNHEYYLYEVHSDWTQLLEEYGSVGLALFLVPFVAVFGGLLRAHGAGLPRRHRTPVAGLTPFDRALPLGALLALAALTVHSLGDFGLQIPALTWGLAAVATCGLLATLPTRGDERE